MSANSTSTEPRRGGRRLGRTLRIRVVAGEVFIDGISVWPDPLEAKRRLGVLPDDLRLFERLSGLELLVYVGLLRGLPRHEIDDRIVDLIAGWKKGFNVCVHRTAESI